MPTFSEKTSGSGPFYVDLTVSQGAQDIADNTSKVPWSLYARLASDGWPTWSGSTQSWTINIGGRVASGTWLLDFRPGDARSILVASGTATVTHNADGTKLCTCAGKLETNSTSFGDGTAYGEFNLDRIPRGPRVRSGGTWQPTVAYVRSGGTWRTAVPYVRVNGSWRIAGG